jgi:putative heme-binding domain-containing protein
MSKHTPILLALNIALVCSSAQAASPVLLDDQFELPKGFHIYKAAPPSLTGGSYVLSFDGAGHLLVGTGETIQRLTDSNQDGLYDKAEMIAEGLGSRDPQGILVHDEHLYAVGGDGVQHFTGYPDKVVHQGRLGEPFHTGGDHAAHTLLRGHDDWIYFVTGDGGGARDRLHITEESSPVLRERNASVFRFNLTGTQWECVSAGGRNPPNLGMNYLGELFSLDSDMEWHVDVPWYRPVRLNHWAVGADLGWQGVGAYPPYYIDTIPGIVDAGRGSPTWGTFYEHQQLPESYHNAFIVCDYRWKSATKGSYNASGRLLSFSIERTGASWDAKMEVLARPKADAVSHDKRPIDFALVDVTVAPDGSLFISDHNQGIWRLFYHAHNSQLKTSIPPVIPDLNPITGSRAELIEQVLDFPQPQSEWTRLRTKTVKQEIGYSWRPALQQYTLDEARPLNKRLRALRLISPEYRRISGSFYVRLAKSSHEELRAQAAWLTGLQGAGYHPQVLHPLLRDSSPFVRRRAAEALTRIASEKSIPPLINALEDADRRVRYTAMRALAHFPTSTWIKPALETENTQRIKRALVAAHVRQDLPPSELIISTINRLISQAPQDRENQLDLFRVFSLFSDSLKNDTLSRSLIALYLQRGFPSTDPDLRWEQARLLGEFDVTDAVPPLLTLLESESDGMTQFHIASSLSRIEDGWTAASQDRLVQWLIRNQTGWFATFAGKGLQFPSFWGTVLNRFCENHFEAIERSFDRLSPSSQLGQITIDQLAKRDESESNLIKLYRNTANTAGRHVVLQAMKRVQKPQLKLFARQQLQETNEADRDELIELLIVQGTDLEDASTLWERIKQTQSASVFNQVAEQLAQIGTRHGHELLLTTLSLGGHTGIQRAVFETIIQRSQSTPAAAPGVDQLMSLLTRHHRRVATNTPRWIWAREVTGSEPVAYFRKQFTVESNAEGVFQITGDNEFIAYLDGKQIAKNDVWQDSDSIRLPLSKGNHELTIRAHSADPTSGLIASLTWASGEGHSKKQLVTNVGWEASITPPADWPFTRLQEHKWSPARDLGPHGTTPWGEVFKNAANDTIEHQLISHYWHQWYVNEYGEAVPSELDQGSAETLSPDAINRILVDTPLGRGTPSEGRRIYLKLQCHTCHQGVPEVTGRIFGPDLAGVTRRLTRDQLADAILQPSKEVAERFRATEVETHSGTAYSGFVTEQSAQRLVIATQTQIITVSTAEVESIQPLSSSLMPEGLLNQNSRQEIIDLLAFLNAL